MKYRYLSIFLILLILSVGAVSAQEDAASDDGVSIAQDNGVLSSAEIVIDDSNYNDYFDNASGMILETSNISGGDTIKLGNISNKDFVFDRLLIITSNSSSDVLTNVTINFVEGSDNSTVSDLNIANGEKTAIVVFEVSNIEISNNVIKVADGDGLYELYAIYAVYANNLRVDTNTITYTGKTNGAASNAVIYVLESEGVQISSNDIDASLISCPIDWKAISAYEYIPNCISQAVYFNECPDVDFILNDIYVEYSNFTGSSDTIYVVNFYDCDNADIEKNTIEGIGHTYIYGLVIRGHDFRVYDNEINMVSDENYTDGIDIEGESTGEVVLNRIFLESPYVAYGIYACDWNMEGQAINYTYNYIGAESHAVYAMSLLYGSESIIEGNLIKIHGNYTMGISSMMMDDLAIIDGNDITVNGLKNDSVDVGDMVPAQTVGILTMSESKITNNIITSAGNWTIINTGYDVEITDNYLVSSELLGDDSVDDRSDEALVENNIPIANATSYDLTNGTFFLFFDENGLLRDNITAESLTFHGEFSELVDQIAIGSPMTLLSDNATLYNLPVLISSSNVVIDGFTFIVDDVNGQLGIVYSDNVSIINSKFIMNGDEEIDNTVIYVIESNNVLIDNNTIDFTVETNDTYENVVICAEECENLTISGNEINAYLPACPIDWTSGTVFTQGVFLDDCDNAVLYDNYIHVECNGVNGNFSTIYAVHIVGDNAHISENYMVVIDAPYGYALVITGDDFLIEENGIGASSDGTYACAINIEGESSGLVDNNRIRTYSEDVAYGIYACDWNMDGQAINYTNNDILGYSYAVYGMELLYGDESLIDSNIIELGGNYTVGIAEMMMYGTTITNNDIRVYGTNNDMVNTGDMVPGVTVGIFSMGDSEIHNNAIYSNGNLTIINSAYDSKITDNYLLTTELVGDDSVNDTLGESLVENNLPITNVTSYNVTNDTFFLFFDDEGSLRYGFSGDTLTFIGEFSNLVDEIFIKVPATLLSDNATFNNIALSVGSDNVTVDGFNFIGEDSAIYIYDSANIKILNNNLNITGYDDWNNVGIKLYCSDNVLIDNNTIVFTVITNDTYKNIAIYADYSDDLTLSNNMIVASLPARPINWVSGTVYSQAVLLDDCDGAVLFNNTIAAKGNDQISTYDTVYAVHIIGDNTTVIGNIIGIIEAPYGYALVISGENFNITGNMIAAGENATYACGIEVDGPSNGVIDNNEIYAMGESAYGIYTANWNGNVRTDIINNSVYVVAVTGFGMSLSGSEASVVNNYIGMAGNFTTGIAAAVDMVFITNNTIIAYGSDVGTPAGYDMMGIETIGIHTVSGDALVKYNNITSNGVFAVEIEGTGAVTHNELYAKVLTGDLAVDYSQDSGVLVGNNTPEMELNYILTNNTFYAYFDKDGRLRGEIKSDNLTFVGEFSNLVTEITIDVPITLLSEDAVLNNMGITIRSDNVTVTGFNFTGENAGFGVYNSDNVVIKNNKVVIKNPTIDSNLCIEIFNSDNVLLYKNVFGLMIGDNNGTYANNIIRAENSNNLYIISNDMAAYLPPRSINWTSGEVYSEGVSLEDCDNAILFNNRIVVMANNDTTSAYGTIYAVHITGDNATIFKNQIGVLEAPYGYALVIQGNNFNITENMIAAGENGTYACGIEVDGPSNGVIDNNQMETRGVSSYGIYAANWNGDIKVNITGNTVVSSGNTVFGLSLTGSEVLVENNRITTKGNFTTAIAYAGDEVIINNNTIRSKGTNIGVPLGYDNMGIYSRAIIVYGNATITSNDIRATMTGICVMSGNAFISDNNIDVKDMGVYQNAEDDASVAICVYSNAEISGNNISYVGKTNGTYVNAVILAEDVDVKVYGNTIYANIMSCPIDWKLISGDYVPTLVSNCIFFQECDDLEFVGNDIIVEYTNFTGSDDTIYVVNAFKCNNALIEGNIINAEGHSYIYGVVIRGENFTISGNDINAYSDENYANGIDIGGESTGIVDSNGIYLSSPDVAYGIYAYNWNMVGQSVDYTNNVIYCDAYVAYGMELLYGDGTLIDYNRIVLDGNYTIGIAEMMMYDGATITNNDIYVYGTSNDMVYTGDMVPAVTVGIFSMGDSEIHNNAITSTGNWTIINSAEDSEITGNYLLSSELMGDDSVDDRSGEAIVENNIPVADVTNYNLTNDTFFLFFNEEGRLRDNITAESLTFIGEFSDLTLWNIIDRPIKLLSDNATLYDMSFVILSDNVAVDGFTFISDNSMANIIYIDESDNVSIVNCTFDVVGVEDDDNVVIAISISDNVTIYNNIIKLEVETNGTYGDIAISATDSSNLNISGNTIAALLPARSIDWSTGTVYSQGVFLSECDDAVLFNNTIAVKSNGQISEYDTIYALHIVGDNATIIGNTIAVLEAPYGYALVIKGSDFNITRNWVGAGENATYACAIDVEGPSNGVIDTNEICAMGESGYGIYTADWAGDVKADIINNVIYVNAISGFGMSLSGSEVSVENNSILVNGNFTTGIASAVENITINNNTILANGSDVGTPPGYDMMGIETIGVHIVSGEAIVTNNNITSNGVFAVEDKGTGKVTDNEIYAKILTGDLAVDYIQESGVIVADNIPEMELDYILTNDTFYAYFDKQGRLRGEIKNDNLTFVGEFSNLVECIYIDEPVKLLSDGAVLNDMAIAILSDNVTVDGFNFTGQVSAIYVQDSDNVKILNTVINITDSSLESNVCIEIHNSANVLVDNCLFLLSIEPQNDTYSNRVIFAEDSDNLTISNNMINALLPARPIDWSTGTVYSQGVFLDNCDNAVLFRNVIGIISNDQISDYDTIYAVHIVGDNATVIGNRIGVLNAPYGYALVAKGDDFNITGNVFVASNGTYDCGIEVDGPSNGVIDTNEIYADGDSAYGIYTANWAGDVKADIINNKIYMDTISGFGMSLSGSEALVKYIPNPEIVSI